MRTRRLIGDGSGSFAVAATDGRLVFTAGQVGADDAGGGAEAPLELQVERAIARLFIVLEEAGTGPDGLLKVNCFLADAADFDRFDAVYRSLIAPPRPPRTTCEAPLAHGWRFEIDAVAMSGR